METEDKNLPTTAFDLAGLVFEQEKQAVTDSLIVAERFDKRHADVLRAIENLECSAVFSQRNFALTSRQDQQNKPQKYYQITRDGFAFLCMGFTGKDAARFKEAFITAFNRMESIIRFGLPATVTDQDRYVKDRFIKDTKFFAFLDNQPAKYLLKANQRSIAESGVDVLAEYGYEPKEALIVGKFWELYDHISTDRDINHSNKPQIEIAISLSQFEMVVRELGLPAIDMDALRQSLPNCESKAYKGLRSVRSRLEKRILRCAVFSTIEQELPME